MISREEIESQIMAQAKQAAEVRAEFDKLLLTIRDYWRSVSPIGKAPQDKNGGAYAASVQVFKKKYEVNGMPARRVGATDYKAHWIEFGTGDPGPTDAFAPRAKTASHFNGDETKVIGILNDDSLSQPQRAAALAQFDLIGGAE